MNEIVIGFAVAREEAKRRRLRQLELERQRAEEQIDRLDQVLMRHNTEGSELDVAIKRIIDKAGADGELHRLGKAIH